MSDTTKNFLAPLKGNKITLHHSTFFFNRYNTVCPNVFDDTQVGQCILKVKHIACKITITGFGCFLDLKQHKLDSIANIISQAMQDGDISPTEFHKILQEKEKYIAMHVIWNILAMKICLYVSFPGFQLAIDVPTFFFYWFCRHFFK